MNLELDFKRQEYITDCYTYAYFRYHLCRKLDRDLAHFATLCNVYVWLFCSMIDFLYALKMSVGWKETLMVMWGAHVRVFVKTNSVGAGRLVQSAQ